MDPKIPRVMQTVASGSTLDQASSTSSTSLPSVEQSGVGKNLTHVLRNLPLPVATFNQLGSPRADRDVGGCQSSGLTTVSAASLPSLDEDPEQTRINMNTNLNLSINLDTTAEMSPRKKRRKQQLSSDELTESRVTDSKIEELAQQNQVVQKLNVEKEKKKKINKYKHRRIAAKRLYKEKASTAEWKNEKALNLIGKPANGRETLNNICGQTVKIEFTTVSEVTDDGKQLNKYMAKTTINEKEYSAVGEFRELAEKTLIATIVEEKLRQVFNKPHMGETYPADIIHYLNFFLFEALEQYEIPI